MADFVKKTWQCGDTITADDFNRVEDGIEEAIEYCGSGVYYVTFSTDANNVWVADKTLSDINDAIARGKVVVGRYAYGDSDIYYYNLTKCSPNSALFTQAVAYSGDARIETYKINDVGDVTLNQKMLVL